MRENRKWRCWAAWVILSMALVAFYPLSRGPFHWLIVHGVVPPAIASRIVVVYVPAARVIDRAPIAVQKAFQRYLNLW